MQKYNDYFFRFFIFNVILGMSCDEHFMELFAPIVVVRERNVFNVIIYYTACSIRRIKYFTGLRIKALSSSGQIPKRVKLFLQHLFFTDGYLFVWNSSAIA